MKNMLIRCMLGVVLLMQLSGAMASSTFSTGSGYYTTLGLEKDYPSDYDHLTVTGKQGTINGTGVYEIASLLFTAGYNAWTIHSDTGSINLDFFINNSAASLILPYTINISYTDTLSLGSGSLSLISGGKSYTVSTLPVSFINIGANQSGSSLLSANVSVSAVPLPGALVLMASGLGILGFSTRRRKEQV